MFGVNDGLVSNTCLVMGVAGAAVEPTVLILTGVAGLLAGAFSMAAGEYISMLSQKEMFEHQIAQEKDELERYPAEEAEELALIYAARGIPLDQARDVAKKLIANPSKRSTRSPARSSGSIQTISARRSAPPFPPSLLFASAPACPSFPSCSGFRTALRSRPRCPGTALFVVGAVLSLFSGRSAIVGGLRMLLIGSAAAAATYFIGSLFNVSAL